MVYRNTKYIFREMSKLVNYDALSKSFDSVREPADAYILKSLMENFTGKYVMVIITNDIFKLLT